MCTDDRIDRIEEDPPSKEFEEHRYKIAIRAVLLFVPFAIWGLAGIVNIERDCTREEAGSTNSIMEKVCQVRYIGDETGDVIERASILRSRSSFTPLAAMRYLVLSVFAGLILTFLVVTFRVLLRGLRQSHWMN